MTSPRHYVRRLYLQWLDKRIPSAHEHHLNLNSIFVLPTGFGWSFILLSLCLFLLGTNYQNNLMLLLSYLCLSIMLLTLFYTHQNFSRLALKVSPVTPFHADKTGEVQFQVIAHENASEKQCYGELQCTWLDRHTCVQPRFSLTWSKGAYVPKQRSHTIVFGKGTAESPSQHTIKAHDSNNRQNRAFKVPLYIPRRGRFPLSRLTISCDFPLGLFQCWTHLDFAQHVTVYAVAKEGPVIREDVAGQNANEHVRQTDSSSNNEDFFALTQYEVGQPLNRVSWKHVAKNRNWVSKSFSSVRPTVHVLSCSPDIDTETALSALTFAIIRWTECDRTFGLHFKNIKILPGCGIQHMHKCLSALACIDTEAPITSTRKNKAVKNASSTKKSTLRPVQ